MNTKQVSKIVLHDDILQNVIHVECYKAFREVLVKKYKNFIESCVNKEWVKFSYGAERGYWNKETQTAIPVQSSYNDKYDICLGKTANDPSRDNVTILCGDNCPQEIVNGIKNSKTFGSNNYHYIGDSEGSYCFETKGFVDWNDGDSIHVNSVNIFVFDFVEDIISRKYTLLINDTQFQKVDTLINNRSISETEDKSKCISNQEVDELLEIFGIDRAEIKAELSEKVRNNCTVSPDIVNSYIDSILSCDKKRADLEIYDRKCLDDINAGHWELWYDNEPVADENQVVVNLQKPLVARNPVVDIHENGLIGIDFGTKSTIVSKRDGREKTTLLRVGTGQLNKKAVSTHYENPTVMEFINLEKFMADYNKRKGRPETSVDDLRVSHTANNDFHSCTKSDNFYSFFYDIKQWCGDCERIIKISDQQRKEQNLPVFAQLTGDALNPLELYAYYLGLYINNMFNGIYIDYVLSFPVGYEKTVKAKMLESFTVGLKKSLPEAVLNNEEVMKKFRVKQGVSEPAAYAITALQGYGFEPEENEKVFYAIFDFGGGTTDFDFGLWRCSDESRRDEQRYDYVIEHFGSECDRYLGGENLLELLAFEVFKANADLLSKSVSSRKNEESEEDSTAGFTFSKPKECDEFPGSETLISSSQEAKRNIKQLMEVLRPFWEGIIGIDDGEEKSNQSETVSYNGYLFRNDEECKFPIEDGIINVDLFDKNGKRISDCRLYIENEANHINLNLIEILEKRIGRGVSNFLSSISKAFRNENITGSQVNEIHIFLAGNSSKSPILRELLDKYISNEHNSIENYHIYPPLGTPEAIEIQKQKNIKINENDITAPTGKTGVAYGLIAGRDGGKIKVISEIKADAQAKFRYNVGISRRGKFRVILDRTLVDYGQWVRLTDAGSEDFEIYYTSQSDAVNISVDKTGIYNRRCRLSHTDENADIYIRCTEDSPEDIEYCISESDEPSEDAEIIRIHLDE